VDHFVLRVTDSRAPFGPDPLVQGNWTRLLLPQYEIDHANNNITHVPYRIIVEVPGRSKEMTLVLDRDLVLSIDLEAPGDRYLPPLLLLLALITIIGVAAVFLFKRRSARASEPPR
jgi:hypothetical protein